MSNAQNPSGLKMNTLQYLNNLRPALPFSSEQSCTLMSNGELRRLYRQRGGSDRWRKGGRAGSNRLSSFLLDFLSEILKEKDNYPMNPHRQPLVDACEILKLYNQRPPLRGFLRLGQWFMNAHGISGYSDLYYEESNLKALHLIRSHGFETWDLEPLMRYNGNTGEKTQAGTM